MGGVGEKRKNKKKDQQQRQNRLGVELTKILRCSWASFFKQHVRRQLYDISAFVCRNIGGCPTNVDTNCYKSLVWPSMQFAATVGIPTSRRCPAVSRRFRGELPGASMSRSTSRAQSDSMQENPMLVALW